MHRLKEFEIDIVGGQIVSRVSAKDSSDDNKKEIKVVVPKSITSTGFIDINEMPVEEVVLDLDNKRITEEGDIVIKLSTPYGAGIVEKDSEGCLVPSFCALIKDTGESIDKNYLLAFLNSDYCKDQIRAQVTGATMTVISVGKIKQLNIPVPSLEEQKRIGEKYVDTKRKIQILQRIVALEEERNSIVFEDLADNE